MALCPNMNKVDVIIPNLNGLRFLEPCLEALTRQDFHGFGVTVVDNGSSDGSVGFLQAHYPHVRVISLPENRGFSAAVNRGVEETDGEYVVLLNNDTEPDVRWLGRLVRALDDHLEVGFCASKVLAYDDTVDTVGDGYTTAGFYFKRGWGREAAGRYEMPEQVFSANGAGAIYRRSLFEDVGLFDEDFFAYGEDVDLGFRAQLRGHSCLYVPTAILYHRGAGTAVAGSELSIYLGHRNRSYVLIKDMPGPLIRKHIAHILCFAVLIFLIYMIKGPRGAFLRAKMDVVRNLGRMYRKRRAIQHRRTVSVEAIEDRMTKDWWRVTLGLSSTAGRLRRLLRGKR